MDIFIYLFAALFSVLNPIGTVPIFVGLTQGYSASERSRTSLITSINVFVILLISCFVGQYVLSFFGITITALRIAGGIIIASSGFSLLNGNFSKNKGINKKVQKEVMAQTINQKCDLVKEKKQFIIFIKKSLLAFFFLIKISYYTP